MKKYRNCSKCVWSQENIHLDKETLKACRIRNYKSCKDYQYCKATATDRKDSYKTSMEQEFRYVGGR